MQKAPPHTPRHPLQDNLYYVLQDYRMSKRILLSRERLRKHRRRALEIIAEIKGRT